MVVRMTSRQMKVLALGVGIMIGGLFAPSLGRLYANYQTAVSQDELERDNIWLAAGIVAERARQGWYRNYEEANFDFDFERIRLMEENLAEGDVAK